MKVDEMFNGWRIEPVKGSWWSFEDFVIVGKCATTGEMKTFEIPKLYKYEEVCYRTRSARIEFGVIYDDQFEDVTELVQPDLNDALTDGNFGIILIDLPYEARFSGRLIILGQYEVALVVENDDQYVPSGLERGQVLHFKGENLDETKKFIAYYENVLDCP